MTPVGRGFTVGDGGYRVFFCRDGRITGSALRWLTPNGAPIGYAPDGSTRNPRRMKLLEESLPSGAISSVLVGRDPFDIDGSEMIQDRISNYYICRPDKSGRHGRLVWKIPRAIGGRKVASLHVLCKPIAGHVGVSSDGATWRETPIDWSNPYTPHIVKIPPDIAGEKICLYLSNESIHECKFFGYALGSR